MYKILVAILIAIVFSLPFVNFESTYDEKEIRLGMSGPFSGNLHSLADEFQVGINTYFRYTNEQGGINGRLFKVITMDDRYEPKMAVENAEKLIIQNKVFGLIGFIGTPTSKAALPIAIKYRIPFIGAFSGAEFLRETPRNPLVLNGRTSYAKEIEALIKYFVDEKHYEKVAIFYQNDSYGQSGLMNIKESLSKRNIKLLAEGSYKRNTLSVGNALYEISQHKPEVIIMVGATKPTAEFIKRARLDENLKDVKFGTISFVGSSMLLNTLDEKVKNIIFSQVVPSPWGALSKEVGLYRDLMDRYNPNRDYSYVSLEGYFIAKMTVEIFKRVGKEFTKEDFIDEMHYIYKTIERNHDVQESERICKCLNKVYLTYYDDGIFWDVNEKD